MQLGSSGVDAIADEFRNALFAPICAGSPPRIGQDCRESGRNRRDLINPAAKQAPPRRPGPISFRYSPLSVAKKSAGRSTDTGRYEANRLTPASCKKQKPSLSPGRDHRRRSFRRNAPNPSPARRRRGIGLTQAAVDGKAFAACQPSSMHLARWRHGFRTSLDPPPHLVSALYFAIR